MKQPSDHGARDHATWSASSTERNWNCPGAIAINEGAPDVETEAAAWGTACHQLSEKCFRQDKDASDFIGTVEKTKKHEFKVDEEMAATAQEYVDYVRGRLAEYAGQTGEDAALYIEQRFSLEKLDPPFDAGGTGDAVMHFPRWRMLEVVDLKGGRGVVVSARDNKQLRTYALGAVLALPGIGVMQVMSTIVQPRAHHKEGRIRSETYHVADLMEWTADLVGAMARSSVAYKAFKTTPRATWAAEHLRAGDHCKFCPSAGLPCPALEKRAMDAVGLWFDDLDQPRLSNAPDDFDADNLARMLDAADMVTEFFNACRAAAHRLADTGVPIPNYQIVERIGRRKWRDEEEAKKQLFLEGELTADELYERELRSPAQIEKVLGAKRKKAMAATLKALTVTPVTGTNLVRVDKTSREAVEPTINKHFDVIE